MTKLNLKYLRQRRDKGYAVPHDDTALLLDWIERARELIQYCIMYQVDDDEVKLGRKLLAELEES